MGTLGICSYFPTQGSGFILYKLCLYIFPPFPIFPCNIFICDLPTCLSQVSKQRFMEQISGRSMEQIQNNVATWRHNSLSFNCIFFFFFPNKKTRLSRWSLILAGRVILSIGRVVCLNLVKKFVLPIYYAYVTLISQGDLSDSSWRGMYRFN